MAHQENNHVLGTFYLVFKQLKSTKFVKKSELELLKFCLTSAADLSTLDSLNCNQFYDSLIDVFNYCSSFLIEKNARETCFKLKHQQIYCDILRTVLLKLLSSENKEIYYKEVYILLENSVNCFRILEKEDAIQEEEQLRIINSVSCILDVVDEISTKLSDQARNYAQHYIIDLFKSLQIIMQNANNTITAHLLISIFKKLYTFNDDYNMLKCIWKTISSFFELVDGDYLKEKHNTAYLMLCCLMEYYFPSKKSMPFIIHEKLFWNIIQHGLKHSNSVSRKRTMFILKWILNWCDMRFEENMLIDMAKLFCWNSTDDNLRMAWENLTVILETLEEKQTHIIKPLLPKLDNLIKSTDMKLLPNCLHSSWIMIVFHRMFHHESKYVVKWAITYFLNLNLEEAPYLMAQIEKFLPTLLETLNDASLYSRSSADPVGSCSPIGLAIARFFKIAYNVLGIKEKQVSFFNYLLTCIYQLSWGGVALFYISYALCQIPSSSLWDEKSVDKIKELILNSLRTQDLLLRGAIQCYFIKSFCQLVDMEKLILENISKLFIVLKRNESFCRGTSLWDITVIWLNEILNKNRRIKEEAIRYFTNILDNYIGYKIEGKSVEKIELEIPNCEAISRTMILLADSFNISNKNEYNKMEDILFNKLLKSTVDTLASANSRPYLSTKNITFCLNLVQHLLLETKLNNPHSTEFYASRSDIRNILIELLYPHINEILCLVSKQILYSFSQFQNIEILQTCLAIFEIIIEERMFIAIWSTLEAYIKQCTQIILQEQQSDSIINFLCCWNYLACVCRSSIFLELHATNIQKDIIKTIKLFINMNNLGRPFVKPPMSSNRISQAIWRNLTSNTECAIWQCIEYYLKIEQDESVVKILSEKSIQYLDIGSSEAIVSMLKCFQHLIPMIYKNDLLFSTLLQKCWKTCLELKKNELFKQAVEAFIYMAYTPKTMISSFKILNKMSNLLIESDETNTFIIYYLIEHCIKIWSSCLSSLSNHLEILCAALTFGPVHRKDQRIINDAVAFIESCGNNLSVNQLIQPVHNNMVRIIAIKFLRTFSNSIIEHQKLANELVLLLINQDKRISSTKLRHFSNSLIHRVKTRIWQIIIFLEPFLSKENCQQLLKIIYSLLVNENHQPSVRYLLEWTIVRVLHHYPVLEKDFNIYFHKAAEKRIGSMVSFISIVIHLSSIVPSQHLENFITTWISSIIPWTMGQNFNTRIYAQLALQKFNDLSNVNKYKNIMKIYEPIFNGIQGIENGNFNKNAQKLTTDFYFQAFNPINHYTMETIFYDLPRLSNLNDEEWILPHLFENYIGNNIETQDLKIINCYNTNFSLKDFKTSEWVLRTSDIISTDVQEESEEISNLTNFQKKITPWKQIIPDTEMVQEIQTRKQWNYDGLIVVASLIDKTPNLGGLCRTCEVFAVTEYVIGSLKYMEDKQFQNLCVSANKWVSVKEVKPHCLKEYLLEMKEEDYTLIGVEQTDNSESLEKFKFPKKSLLLLGNEKEGLPVELIHLLDVCVEIPQQGIIRSLNVHVSGAILIWEYARQHNLTST